MVAGESIGTRQGPLDAGRGWPPGRVIAGFAGSGAVALLAHRRGSLSRGGVLGALGVGTVVFGGGGALPAALVLTFFGSSTALSHWRQERKRAVASEFAKGERRDAWQVLANGGAASALVAFGHVRPEAPWFAGLVGALATVNADTWATEVGILSARPPRLITTLRPVRAGASGGVTPLGAGAAFLGAALIGAVAALGSRLGLASAARCHPVRMVPLAVVAGLAGSFCDSLLGATVQARYHCPVCDLPTERRRHRCGATTRLAGGWRWCDNDLVNFLSSLCGAAVGWGCGSGK